MNEGRNAHIDSRLNVGKSGQFEMGNLSILLTLSSTFSLDDPNAHHDEC